LNQAYICVSQSPAMAAKMKKRYGQSLDPNGKLSERWAVSLKSVSFRSTRTFLTSGARTKHGFSKATELASVVQTMLESKSYALKQSAGDVALPFRLAY
jgi:hypothetical protein